MENDVVDNILVERKEEIKIIDDNPAAKILQINNRNHNRYLATEEEVDTIIAWFNVFPSTTAEPLKGMPGTSNYGNAVCFAYTLDPDNFTAKTWVPTVLSYRDVVYTSMPLDTEIKNKKQIFFWYFAVNVSTVTSCNSSSVPEALSISNDTWQNLNLEFLDYKYGLCYNNHFIGIAPDSEGASVRTFPMDDTPDDTPLRPKAPKVELLTYNWAVGYEFCKFGFNGTAGPQIFTPDALNVTEGHAWFVDTCPKNESVNFVIDCRYNENNGMSHIVKNTTKGCENTATILTAIGRINSTEYPLEAFSIFGYEDCVPCVSEDNVCFAGSESILLESGDMKLMQDIRVGDRVQVSSNDGRLFFSDVIFLPHGNNQKLSHFIELETNVGSLKVTEKHLVRVSSDCSSTNNEFELVYAENIEIGQCLDHVEGKTKVINTQLTKATGIYTIITAHFDGIVVVNGFKASSFGVNHIFPNTYYHLHRLFYSIGLISKQEKQSYTHETLLYMGNILGKLANLSF